MRWSVEITEEQRELIKEVQQEWIDLGIRSDGSIAPMEELRELFAWLYRLNDYVVPKDIYVVGNPVAMQMKAMELLGVDEPITSASRGIAYDASWTAFYDFYQRCGVEQGEDFQIWMEFLRAGIWDTVLMDEAAVVCRRPIEVHYDDQQRLHNLTGPAVRWVDGHESFLIANVYVKRHWVMEPEKITVREVLRCTNVELRRILLAQMGYERFGREANAVVVDSWVDGGGEPGEVLEIPMQDDEPVVLYHFCCPSTKKRGFLRIPPHIRKCVEAQAWGFDVSSESFRPRVEM